MTEGQIRAAWVDGAPPLLSGPILLAEYDPTWPQLFEREAERIRAVLGERVVRLEHTGSTSVPGLAAKPIIDMLLVVPDSSDEPKYVPALEDAGYTLRIREPDWNQHRMLKGPDTDVNLHVLSAGCPEVDRVLCFRDRLRTHDEERKLYEHAKRELAAKEWQYVQNYADAKSEVIEGIVTRALSGDGRTLGRCRSRVRRSAVDTASPRGTYPTQGRSVLPRWRSSHADAL